MPLSFQPSTSPLFTKLGKIVHAAKTLNTARRTTVPTEIEDILDQYATGSIELQSIPDPLADASSGFRSAGDSLLSSLREVFQATIIRYVKEDEQQPSDSLEDALRELVRQMEETNTFVEYIAPTATVAEVAAVGNGAIAVSAINRFGERIAFAYDEVITIECTDDATEGAEVFRFRGELSEAKLSDLWPAGSGLDTTLTAVGPSDRRNLIENGSFETTDDDDATLPDGWIDGDGTAAALVSVTPVEVQTLTTTGTPTGGFYYISWTSGGVTQRTDALAYNAGQSAVQAALRSLKGLEQVTVVTTGTTPNFTHTITFTGVPLPNQLLVEDAGLTGGTTPAVTPATTTAGEGAYGARVLRITSNGSESGTFLYQRLTGLTGGTAYAFALHFSVNTANPTQGEITAKLVDGIAGSTINDEAGTANSLAIPYTADESPAVTNRGTVVSGFFRTPLVLPAVVYLELSVTDPFDNTFKIDIDAVRLVEATELYAGGPLVAVFSGVPGNSAEINGNFVLGDKFTLTIANAYTAEFQQWFQRLCDTEALELQLPSASGTSSSTNEVQTLTITGTPTGGTFTISYDGQTTATIAYNANAAAVQSALEALSNIEVGDVTCGGGGLPGTPVTITFTGNLAGRNVSLMTADGSGLTGGSSPTAAIALTTAGVGYISDSVFIT